MTSCWVALVIATYRSNTLSMPAPDAAGVDRDVVDREVVDRDVVDDDDKVELQPLRQLGRQPPNTRIRPGRADFGVSADHADDAVLMHGKPGVQDRLQIQHRSVNDGNAIAANGGGHVGVRDHRPDHRLRFCHDLRLRRRAVIDVQPRYLVLIETDPTKPFLPRLGESVSGLGPSPTMVKLRDGQRSNNICHSASVNSCASSTTMWAN